MIKAGWSTKALVVGGGAAMLVALAAVPAQAVTLSTTGAVGRTAYIRNGDYELFARDPLTDGHCARWQERLPNETTWRWKGSSACSSTEQFVGFSRSGHRVRICRTGVGNCSSATLL